MSIHKVLTLRVYLNLKSIKCQHIQIQTLDHLLTWTFCSELTSRVQLPAAQSPWKHW